MSRTPVKKYKCPLVYELLIHGKYHYVGMHDQSRELSENDIKAKSGNPYAADCVLSIDKEERRKKYRDYMDNTEVLWVRECYNHFSAYMIERFKIDGCREEYGDDCINQADGIIRTGLGKGQRKPGIQRSVLQYDRQGTFIARYDSMTDAANMLVSTLGVPQQSAATGIKDCAKGKVETAHGFVWKYEDPNGGKHNRAILKFDEDFNLLAEYPAVRYAVADIMANNPSLGLRNVKFLLSKALNKKARSAYGYIWRYKDQLAQQISNDPSVDTVDEPAEDLVDEVEDLTED